MVWKWYEILNIVAIADGQAQFSQHCVEPLIQ